MLYLARAPPPSLVLLCGPPHNTTTTRARRLHHRHPLPAPLFTCHTSRCALPPLTRFFLPPIALHWFLLAYNNTTFLRCSIYAVGTVQRSCDAAVYLYVLYWMVGFVRILCIYVARVRAFRRRARRAYPFCDLSTSTCRRSACRLRLITTYLGPLHRLVHLTTRISCCYLTVYATTPRHARCWIWTPTMTPALDSPLICRVVDLIMLI